MTLSLHTSYFFSLLLPPPHFSLQFPTSHSSEILPDPQFHFCISSHKRLPSFLNNYFCKLLLIICVDSPWISLQNESEILRSAMTYTKYVKKWLFSGLLFLDDGVGGFLSPARCHCHYFFWSRHKSNNTLVIYMASFTHNNDLRTSEGLWTDPVQSAKPDWPDKNQYSRWGRRISYWPLRKHRLGRQEGKVALYVTEQLECMKLCLGMDEEPTDSMWLRIKER